MTEETLATLEQNIHFNTTLALRLMWTRTSIIWC